MGKKIEKMKYVLMTVLAALLGTMFLTSCGDDEPDYDEMIYYTVKQGVEGSSSKLASEVALIKETFYKELGIKSGETSFMFEGTVERCNSRVVQCCTAAKAKLAGETWSVKHTFVVTNVNTEKVVYEYVVGG